MSLVTMVSVPNQNWIVVMVPNNAQMEVMKQTVVRIDMCIVLNSECNNHAVVQPCRKLIE